MASSFYTPLKAFIFVFGGKNLVSKISYVNYSRLRYLVKNYHVLSSPRKDDLYDISSKPDVYQRKYISTCKYVTTNIYSSKLIKNLLTQNHFISENVKSYSSKNNFTFENPEYVSFVKSLEDEFKSMQSSLKNKDEKEKMADKTYGRLVFLESVANIADILNEKNSEVEELLELSKNEDKEIKELADNDISVLKQQIEELEQQMALVLVGDEIADNSGINIEVTAGVGGQEAMIFASEIFNMYVGYANYKNWNITEYTLEENSLGGSTKAFMQIHGEDVYKHLKHESGVHRVQRIPKTEKSSRMHTSTVTVSVLPVPRDIDTEINTKDLKIETMRGSGPGGQSVNTTDSAVRITHLPTGTVSECKEERTQILNKKKAMEKLKSRIYQEKVNKLEAERRASRKMQIGNRGRSEKVRTYNFRDDRISDHRISGNVFNILNFLNGQESLDELIADLDLSMKHEMLESMLDQFILKKKKVIE